MKVTVWSRESVGTVVKVYDRAVDAMLPSPDFVVIEHDPEPAHDYWPVALYLFSVS